MTKLFSFKILFALLVAIPAFAEWHLDAIQAPKSPLKASHPVKVAIMDFDFDAADLRIRSFLRFSEGFDFSSNNWRLLSDSLRPHGSQVASVVESVLPKNSRIQLIPYNLFMASDRVFEAIELAIENNVKVINMSFAVGRASADYVKKWERVTRLAQKAGVIFVAAAGNESSDLDQEPLLPAALSLEFDNVITVGASDRRDGRWPHSNYGSALTLFAPGEDIPILVPGGAGFASGTSEAAPLVTGVIATLLSQFPNLQPAQIKQILVKTADRPESLSASDSRGRLNARRALEAAARISSSRHRN